MEKNQNKFVKLAKYMVPLVLVLSLIFYLSSGVVGRKDTLKEIEKVKISAERTTTTLTFKSTASSESSISTKNVSVLGLADIEFNFNKIYGKPKITDLSSEYEFVGGKMNVTYAPDVKGANRAWQLFITQRPTSRKLSNDYVAKFIPVDSKVFASVDKDLEGILIEYRSDTLASLYSPEMFLNNENKPVPGYFRVIYDINDSNLVYQIRIIGGFTDF